MPSAPAPGTPQGGLEVRTVNGVRIARTDTGGSGTPAVLVHGSWTSHGTWARVVPLLARDLRVVTYDRRGHGDSTAPPGQGHFSEDVADLAALVEQLDLAPAWVVGSSAGAVITLRLAASRPDLLQGVVVHEPPLFSVLHGDEVAAAAAATGPLAEVGRLIAAGEHARAAEHFADQVALGPGSWARMPADMQRRMTDNAPTYLDELNDPEATSVDESLLARYDGPVLITAGGQSPPVYGPVSDRLAQLLPQAVRSTYEQAGHLPHVTHPEEYAAEVVAFTREQGG